MHTPKWCLSLVCLFALAFPSTALAGALFVSSFDTKTVYLIDADTGNVIRSYAHSKLANPTGLALSPDGQTLYVASGNNTGDDVLQFNTVTGDYLGGFEFFVRLPGGLALTDDGRTLYVGYGLLQGSINGGHGIASVDTQTGVKDYLSTLSDYPLDLQLSPDEAFIYTAGSFAHAGLKITVTTGAVVPIFDFSAYGGASGIAMSPDGSSMYWALRNGGSSNKIMVLNSGATFTLPGAVGTPFGLDITPDGSTLFASDATTDNLYRIDINSATASLLNTTAILDAPGYLLYTDNPAVIPEPVLDGCCTILLFAIFRRQTRRSPAGILSPHG